MNVKHWMAWEGGVDFCGVTPSAVSQSNVIVHVARMVHTPIGSAPSPSLLVTRP